MTVTSTVPAAIAALQLKMQTVVTSPQLQYLNASVYVGGITDEAFTDNYLAIGDPEGQGGLVENYVSKIQGFYSGGGPMNLSEDYTIVCSARAWAGSLDEDPTLRLTDAMALLRGVQTQLALDPKASDALGAGGVWQIGQMSNPVAGPMNGMGWGVLLDFTVLVQHVQLINQ